MGVTLSRRRLLAGQFDTAPHLRPPWALSEQDFVTQCTRCNACIEHCETQIIIQSRSGFPEVDFSRGECIFCQACVQHCDSGALSLTQPKPWQQHIQITTACITQQQIVCRSCADQCEPNAIRFRPQLGGVSQPSVDIDACTGCGACIAGCPTQAIQIHPTPQPAATTQEASYGN